MGMFPKFQGKQEPRSINGKYLNNELTPSLWTIVNMIFIEFRTVNE